MSSESDSSSSSSSSSESRERRQRKKEKKRARVDRPSDADLEETLAKQGYRSFTKLNNSRRQVKCSLCNKELARAFASDLDAHLKSQRHRSVEAARHNARPLADLLNRPVGMAAASPVQLHQYYTIIHLLKCNVALSTVGDLLTDKFLEALKRETRVGGRHLLNQLDSTVQLIKAAIHTDVKDKFVSILADETPCRNGAGFVCVMAATADKLHVLRAIKFDLERTLNAEGLKAEVLAAVQEYGIDRPRIVALVLDNVSYGEVAYDSLQSGEPGFDRLIKIGCIAHTLNLMAHAYTQRAFFSHTHTLLDQLRKVLCAKHGKLERQVRKEFAACLGRSTSILDFVETRWSEWLNTLHWVHDNTKPLRDWLAAEADRLHALVLPTRKENNKRNELEQHLRDLHRMLRSAATCAEMAVLNEPALTLSEFILLAQRSDPIAFARHAQRLQDWVSMLTLYAEPAREAELRTQITRALSHDLVLAPALVDDLLQSTRSASLACKEKFDKHSGTTMAVLNALALFDEGYWRRNPVPETLPAALLEQFIPPQDLMSTRTDWLAVRRCPLFQQLSAPLAPGAPAEVPPHSSLKTWRAICDTAGAPKLRNLVERLFSVRQGIADVERAFSRLRAIDSAHRALANPATQEAEFFLSVNAANFDAYSE